MSILNKEERRINRALGGSGKPGRFFPLMGRSIIFGDVDMCHRGVRYRTLYVVHRCGRTGWQKDAVGNFTGRDWLKRMVEAFAAARTPCMVQDDPPPP